MGYLVMEDNDMVVLRLAPRTAGRGFQIDTRTRTHDHLGLVPLYP